jgi:hypothetical protein
MGKVTLSPAKHGPVGDPLQVYADRFSGHYALTYEASNLTAGKQYTFYVNECDAISCAPTSNQLTISTSPAGSDQVTFSLDRISNVIGPKATVSVNGTFSATVPIPSNTTPGQHTLYANVGTEQAEMPINICPATGCNPTLTVLYDGVAVAPGWRIEAGFPIDFYGTSFTAGRTVTLTVDSAGGTRIGSATVGSNQSFNQTFTMPSVSPGTHNIVATETVATETVAIENVVSEIPITISATFSVYVDSIPQ